MGYVNTMLYEAASDLVCARLAHLSHLIAEEERQPVTNFDRILELETAMLDCSREFDALAPMDYGALLALLQRYVPAEQVDRLTRTLARFHADEAEDS